MASFLAPEFEMYSTYNSEILNQSSVSEHTPLVHQLQFSNSNELIVKLSQAIFEDFAAYASSADDQKSTVQAFYDITEAAATSFGKLYGLYFNDNDDCRQIVDQIKLECNVYALILRILHVNEEAKATANDHLTKLKKENIEFRRLWALFRWSEEVAARNPSGFSAVQNQTSHFANIKNIYRTTTMHGKFGHMDAEHNGTAETDDLENIQLLHKTWFALLRAGRLDDARKLVHKVGLAGKGAFVYLREFLHDGALSPLDVQDTNYNVARSRLFAKRLARELILVKDTVTSVDQCIWAMLSGSLSTLLTHAQTTDDRLWAYLTSAVDAFLDGETATCRHDPETVLARDVLAREEVEMTVEEIFYNIGLNEHNIYYTLLSFIANEDADGALRHVQQHVNAATGEIPPHQLRFLTHFVVLVKRHSTAESSEICDVLLDKYVAALQRMKLNGLVPHYLAQCSTEVLAHAKMIDFLEGIGNNVEQEELLAIATELRFDVGYLCVELYDRHKLNNQITADENQVGQAATNMIRAWHWLRYGGADLVGHAIIEANYLLRKFMLYNHVAQALEFLHTVPEDLPAEVEKTLSTADENTATNKRLVAAQDEFECYTLYFKAMTYFNAWQKHIDSGMVVQQPPKLTEEQWENMDVMHRDKFNVSVRKAEECQKKHDELNKLQTKLAVEMLERVLLRKNGWLVADTADEDSMDVKVRERISDFIPIRDNCLYVIAKSLITVLAKNDDPRQILDVAVLLVDPMHQLDTAISASNLRKLLSEISKAGVAIV